MTGLRSEAEAYFRDLRDRICARLEELDSARFVRRAWKREGGGGGEMSELRGEGFGKAGCNFSAVWGEKYPPAVDPSSSDRSAPAPPDQSAQSPSALDTRGGIRPPTPAEVAGKPVCATRASL